MPVKGDNFASTRVPEGHTTACDNRSAIMIPKVGAGPRLILPSEPTAIPVAIIWALSLYLILSLKYYNKLETYLVKSIEHMSST